MSLDELVRDQLIASAELAIAAAVAGLRDIVLIYEPGDVPCVFRQSLPPDDDSGLEICTDGRGTFDVWTRTPLRIIKTGVSLTDAVRVLVEARSLVILAIDAATSAAKMKRRAMEARRFASDGAGDASTAIVKRRPDDRPAPRGRSNDAHTSSAPAPHYGDLADIRQPHHRLVAGRGSGFVPGSFPSGGDP